MYVFVCFGVSYEIVFVLCIFKKSRTIRKTNWCLRFSVMTKKIREIKYVNFYFHEKKKLLLLVSICSLLMFICIGLELKTFITHYCTWKKKKKNTPFMYVYFGLLKSRLRQI